MSSCNSVVFEKFTCAYEHQITLEIMLKLTLVTSLGSNSARRYQFKQNFELRRAYSYKQRGKWTNHSVRTITKLCSKCTNVVQDQLQSLTFFSRSVSPWCLPLSQT